jgi:hypothetical protein
VKIYLNKYLLNQLGAYSDKYYMSIRIIILFTIILALTFCRQKSHHNSLIENEIVFTEHIQAIIHKNCSPCHNDGGIAPFPLINYEDIKSKAPMIRYVISNRYMPPWKADRNYGHFIGERGLTQGQIDSIVHWIDNNCPHGDRVGKDLIFERTEISSDTVITLSMQKAYYHTGDGKDKYMNFYLPVDFKQDYWLKAIEIIPGNRRIVHHAWIFSNQDNLASTLNKEQITHGFEGGFGELSNSRPLVGYLPGMDIHNFGRDFGKKIISGTQLFLQIHYFGTSLSASDQTKVILYLNKEQPKNKLEFAIISEEHISNGPLEIPANKIKRFKGWYRFDEDVYLYSITPHMHFRGKWIRAYAKKPGSLKKIPLIHIPDWDFNWQFMYNFKDHVYLPRGSKIYFNAEYDNTSRNLSNPVIPPVDVINGESSMDEMMQIILEYYTIK